MTTHELARLLLTQQDRDIKHDLCRACLNPILPADKMVGTAVSAQSPLGYGIYLYHESCLDNLAPDARKEVGLIASKHFRKTIVVHVAIEAP